jgi:uncharacterized membrane protein YjdF
MRNYTTAQPSDPAVDFQLRPLLPILGFTLAYIVVASVYAADRDNLEFLIYILVMIILMFCVWLVHRRVHLSLGLLWALSVWGLAHMAGGLLVVPATLTLSGDTSVLYNLWLIPGLLKYDQLVHAYGFGITTLLCWQGISAAAAREGVRFRPSPGLLSLAAFAAMGLGALNEVIEFMASLLLAETNVGGYLNTGWDLVANGVGAIIAAIIIRVRWRTNKSSRSGTG